MSLPALDAPDAVDAFDAGPTRPVVSLDDVVLPDGWELLAGADTGTYLGCTFTAISPDPYEAIVLAEFPNYRYVGGVIELLGYSIGEWCAMVLAAWGKLTDRPLKPWVDANTQFAAEFATHGIHVQRNARPLEVRTEIMREYVQHRKLRLVPWLDVLPYEMEEAVFPPEASLITGRYQRLKAKDHILDTVEHCLSRRPRSKRLRKDEQKKSFIQQHLERHAWRLPKRVVPHLGRN